MRLFALLLLSACAGASAAQPVPAPSGAQRLLVLAAKGTQNYKCADGAWKLTGPDAELFDDGGKKVGQHGAKDGKPFWRLDSGSQVNGAKKEAAPSPDGAGNIDWLLLEVVGHEGQGALDKARFI